jgi:hypothetical protein
MCSVSRTWLACSNLRPLPCEWGIRGDYPGFDEMETTGSLGLSETSTLTFLFTSTRTILPVLRLRP